MENIATLLGLLSIIGLGAGVHGAVKGKVKFLKITSKKNSVYLLIGSFFVLMVAGSMMPSEESPSQNNSTPQVVEALPNDTQDKEINFDEESNDEVEVSDEIKEPVAKQDEPSEQIEAQDDTDTPIKTDQEITVASVPIKDLQGNLTVHYIDVGQGQSQLIIGSTGKVMLIDAGDNDDEKLMVEYLKKEKIEKIDILIGTHPHADHIGGMDAVINNFEIGTIYMPRFLSNTKTFEDVLLAIQAKNLKVTTAKAGLTLDLGEDINVKMIAPIGDYNDANEMSAVVHLTFGNISFLFTGDAESKSEADMIRTGENLKADVLLVGHHGSNTSTSKAFLDKVNPSYAVIQTGKDNSYGHPTSEILNRLNDSNVEIYRNDEQGHIVITSDGENISVNTDAWKPTEQPKPVQTTKPIETAPEPIQAITEVANELIATASISSSTPKQNSTVSVTTNVKDNNGKPVSGAKVDLSLKYKSTTTKYDGVTNSNGDAVITFKIGRAAKDFTVNGDITITHGDIKTTTKTSFTPQ